MKRPMSQTISLIMTWALVTVLIGSGGIIAAQVLSGHPSDINVARIFEGLLLVFATAWKTEHGVGTTVNASPTDSVTVNAGNGNAQPSPPVDPAEGRMEQ